MMRLVPHGALADRSNSLSCVTKSSKWRMLMDVPSKGNLRRLNC
jgi:hypothetical protein